MADPAEDIARIRRDEEALILLLDELVVEALDERGELCAPELADAWHEACPKSWWSKSYAKAYVRRYLTGCEERGELVSEKRSGPTGWCRNYYRRPDRG